MREQAGDDRELVERARTDPDAFGQLYRRYVDRIHAFAWRRSGSREVAEEVTSATFERVLRALPSFEWKGGGFEPWLYRIAATEVAAYYRRESRADRPRAQMALRELAPVGPDGGADDADGADPEVIRRALTTLRPRYQEAITLRYLAGLSAEEAASALGCSKAVLAVTLHRALGSLRRAVHRTMEEAR